MLQLLAAIAICFLLVGAALRLASWLRLGDRIAASAGAAHAPLHAFIDELLTAIRGGPVHSRPLLEAIEIARSARTPDEARAALETRHEQTLRAAGLRRNDTSLSRFLPLIAFLALTLGAAGLITGGISPGRLAGIPAIGLLLMLFAGMAVVVRVWAVPARPRARAWQVLRHAMIVESVSAAKAGLDPASIHARLLLMVPASVQVPARESKPSTPRAKAA